MTLSPMPVAASVIDLNSLRVHFSEDVDSVAAENPDNYRITSTEHAAYARPRAPSSVKYSRIR